MMKERFLATLGVVGLLVTMGCASTSDKDKMAAEKAPAVQQEAVPEVGAREVTTITATVQAVNLEKRLVTLKQKGGKPFTIHVSEEARNLPQVKVGDKVVVKYSEAVALRLSKDTTTGGVTTRKETLSGTRAEPGQKPAGSVTNNVEIVANVIAINAKTRKVTIQGPEHAVTVKAPSDVDLSQIKVGDQILINYVEELAITVEPAPAKKPAKPAKK